MGTRSLTFFYETEMADPISRPFLNMYRQFDGYPAGHGLELSNFLNGMTMVNGYGSEQEDGGYANGMGCLAAQAIAHFKQGIGGFYIVSVDERDCGQDYEYHVYPDGVVVKRYDDDELFSGSWSEFDDFCENAE
jgi:hypothetical protein